MSEITQKTLESILALQDVEYRDFEAKIIPNVDPERVIGVRTPELRQLAREMVGRGEAEEYLAELPHQYFEENQLHAFLLSLEKDYGRAVSAVNAFLPYVDNWATCDQLSPRSFRKHRPELLREIDAWLASPHTYTVRFGVGMLMEHYLDGDFKPKYLARVAALRSEEYYINMMIAWYFATALAKQYDAALPYFEQRKLAPWTHNKAIQKAIESRRVTPEHKEALRALKILTKNEK
ncbi:MAG: DNA alkylation repair protein [Ruminococcaceae bacterium]|nr:DNA alkylation repair protein [Oscillospiraceae bacterium]